MATPMATTLLSVRSHGPTAAAMLSADTLEGYRFDETVGLPYSDCLEATLSDDTPTGSGANRVSTDGYELPKDLYLDVLMDFTLGYNNDSQEGSFGITLVVQGQAVSGLAISHDAWTREFVQQVGGANEVLGNAMETLFTTLQAHAFEEESQGDPADKPRPVRRFIHLRDATVFSGGTRLNVGLIRVSLANVAGWSLGNLDA